MFCSSQTAAIFRQKCELCFKTQIQSIPGLSASVICAWWLVGKGLAITRISTVLLVLLRLQEPQDLSSEFTSCLNLLKGSQKDSYDPWTHPTLEEFKELVMVAQGGDENDDEDVAMEEDSEVVVNQVTMSFKCPITKQFYVRPVTSKTCNHSYSQEAVQEHIRKRL